jgi:hypothetical protein
LKKSSEIDARILEWTFQSRLGGEDDALDDALEKFFKAVPGFFDSKGGRQSPRTIAR